MWFENSASVSKQYTEKYTYIEFSVTFNNGSGPKRNLGANPEPKSKAFEELLNSSSVRDTF